MHVHETVERVGANIIRCNIGGSTSERCLEVPAWMFDRGVCAAGGNEASAVNFEMGNYVVVRGDLKAVTKVLQEGQPFITRRALRQGG